MEKIRTEVCSWVVSGEGLDFIDKRQLAGTELGQRNLETESDKGDCAGVWLRLSSYIPAINRQIYTDKVSRRNFLDFLMGKSLFLLPP